MAPKRPRSKEAEEEAPRRVTRRSTRLHDTHSDTMAQNEHRKSKTSTKEIAKKVKNGSTQNMKNEAPPPPKVADGWKSKTIVIEHCKQCNSFKTRAIQVKDGLEKGLSGVRVLVNPEKPRRGCFEIREEGGEKFISLLDMKRPFAPMKALDMSEVISDIIHKIK